MKKGFLQWSPFAEKTKYFEPSTKEYMINYRVDNLVKLIDLLKKEGVTVTIVLKHLTMENLLILWILKAIKLNCGNPMT